MPRHDTPALGMGHAIELPRYAGYLRYVLVHKYWVAVACFRLGIPLRGLAHDLSKLRPGQMSAYARHFYAPDGTPVSGVFDAHGRLTADSDEHFRIEHLRHVTRSPHHPEAHVAESGDGRVPRPMSRGLVLEMLADWWSVSRVRGTGSPSVWYSENRDLIEFHEDTRRMVESMLPVLDRVLPGCQVAVREYATTSEPARSE